MNTSEGYEIRTIHHEVRSLHAQWAAFLAENGLREERVDFTLGIFGPDDTLAGTASLCGNIIKEVAVAAPLRGGPYTAALVSRLLAEAADRGHSNVMVFARPEYGSLFRSLAFRPVGSSSGAVLMESHPRGLSTYLRSLATLRRPGRNGVIVMNANPLTQGHLWLIRRAAARVDNLYIIPVADNDANEFTYEERIAVLRRSTASAGNVTVCPGSSYTVSASTFPSYFIKQVTDATDIHIALDLDIFARCIAPALGAVVRFAGSEPSDPLTARYNELMERILPEFGIEVVVMERLECDGVAVSASAVRAAMRRPSGLAAVAKLAARESIPYVMAHMAVEALRSELATTPKPGLVDSHDSGAHRDMDFHLMQRGIDSLAPWFAAIAVAAWRGEPGAAIRALGVEAEAAMFRATGGVNTHKGALFCLGLTLAAACRLVAGGAMPSAAALQQAVAQEAAGFEQPEDTHGGVAIRRFGRGGALASAREGYARVYSSWVPFLRSLPGPDTDAARLLTLLRIMSELDDSNILYRCGAAVADEVKARSLELSRQLEAHNVCEAMRVLNEEFAARGISPGGAADMLSLTLFIDKIIPT